MKLPVDASTMLDFYHAFALSANVQMCENTPYTEHDWRSYLSTLDFQAIRAEYLCTVLSNLRLACSQGHKKLVDSWFEQNQRSLSCPLKALTYDYDIDIEKVEPISAFCGRSLAWLYAIHKGPIDSSVALLSARNMWDHKSDVVFWQQQSLSNTLNHWILENTFFETGSLDFWYLEQIKNHPSLYFEIASKSLIVEPFLLSVWRNSFADLFIEFPLFDLTKENERIKLSHILQWKKFTLQVKMSTIEVDFDF